MTRCYHLVFRCILFGSMWVDVVRPFILMNLIRCNPRLLSFQLTNLKAFDRTSWCSIPNEMSELKVLSLRTCSNCQVFQPLSQQNPHILNQTRNEFDELLNSLSFYFVDDKVQSSYYEDSDHQTFNLKLSRRKFHLQTIWSQDSNYESKFLIATTSKQFENRKVQLEIPRTIQLFTKRASPCVAPTRSESPGTGGSKSNLVSSRLQAIIQFRGHRHCPIAQSSQQFADCSQVASLYLGSPRQKIQAEWAQYYY